MSIRTDDLGRITQQTSVVSSDGERLGSINQVYTSDTTGDPAWVTVKTGLFGTQESFVPLSDASFDGDDIRVGVTKDAVKDAPRVDSDGHLTPEEEDQLYRHYGLHDPDGSTDATGVDPADGRADGRADGERGKRDEDAVTAGTGPAAGAGLGTAAGHDRDDRSGDDRDDRLGDDRDDRPGDDRADDGGAGREAAAAGGGAGVGAAAGSALGGGVGRDRDGDDGDRVAPRHAAPGDPDDRSVAAENGPEHVQDSGSGQGGGAEQGEQEASRPGERTTRLKRYVVTERVVQTVEELPDEDSPTR